MNKRILKEFQETNFQSFSDGQINIVFPNEEDLRQAEVTLTPTDGHYKGGEYKFEITLPTNYPESVASVRCKTKIFHPNIGFDGGICFNLLSDEWNADVRLVDYAHGLLWLLYQPNLGSRLNGSVPNDPLEFAKQVHLTLQGKTVAGIKFPQFIACEPDPAPKPDEPRFTVEQLVRMFSAPHPPPQPEPFFRMRIPDGRTPIVQTPLTTTVAPVFATNAPPPPPMPHATVGPRPQPTFAPVIIPVAQPAGPVLPGIEPEREISKENDRRQINRMNALRNQRQAQTETKSLSKNARRKIARGRKRTATTMEA